MSYIFLAGILNGLATIFLKISNDNLYEKDAIGYQNSSLAPSFHIEAFWNFGLFGLILVSVFYGVVMTAFSNIILNAKN